MDSPSAGSPAAGSFGNAVEWYDFAVLGASATLLANALTPGGAEGLTSVFAILAVALVVRPVGALAGALWADRIGRRLPLIISVSVMSLATAGIALLPSWATAGVVAVVLLVLLRVLQGLSTGAELVVSVTYLYEHAPQARRGVWGGLHMATIALGFSAGTWAVALNSALLGDEALASWGWRLPFLVALPLGLVALRLRHRMAETPAYLGIARAGARAKRPMAALAAERGVLVAGFLMISGLMSSFTLWFVFLPARLVETTTVPLHVVLACAGSGLVAVAVSAILCGHASDSWGRKPLIAAGIAVMSATWAFGYAAAADASTPSLLAWNVAAGAALGAFVVQSALAEAFRTPVRALGIAATFGLASALVGGTSPLVADLLARVDPALVPAYALAWLLAAAGATAALRGPVDEDLAHARDAGGAESQAGRGVA